MMATTLVLVRHGQTDYNLEGRMQGQMDTPLNTRGREQAAALGAQMKARCEARGIVFNAQVSSPLQRARDTGLAIRAAIGAPLESLELHELSGLMERSGGACEDLLFSDPAFEARRASSLEPMSALTERAVTALRRAAELCPAGGGGWVLGTTHGGVLAALARAAEIDEGATVGRGAPPNCAVATFKLAADGRLRMLAPGFEELI